MYDIDKPKIKDKKWLIFENTIFDDLSFMDCNDTIEGVCILDKTFDQCVKKCEDDPNCAAGYYISGLEKNICVPLRTEEYHYVNPIYRLRQQKIYNELDNLDVKTFVDKSVYPFPPEQANPSFLYGFTINQEYK